MLIDQSIGTLLDGLGYPPLLDGAIRYAVLGGGKRFRPLLAIESARACGGSGLEALGGAIAIELVHAFSLVHDDLPALDNDDLRRGKPTLHKHAGEPLAILAGDQLLTLAFGALTEGDADAPVAARLTGELVAGTTSMIVGQTMDMALDTPPGEGELAKLEAIHARKTGALIRAACRMGAIAGGASAAHLDAVTRYADAIGLMFQIVDDLLDVEACHTATGKRTGKDADAGKLTYPGVMGVEAAREEVARLGREAREAIAPFADRGAALSDLAAYLERRGA